MLVSRLSFAPSSNQSILSYEEMGIYRDGYSIVSLKISALVLS